MIMNRKHAIGKQLIIKRDGKWLRIQRFLGGHYVRLAAYDTWRHALNDSLAALKLKL